MAFIRKRGQSYYLVHNVRQDGRVRQLHLARLGRRPHISDDVIRGVSFPPPLCASGLEGAAGESLPGIDSAFRKRLAIFARAAHDRAQPPPGYL